MRHNLVPAGDRFTLPWLATTRGQANLGKNLAVVVVDDDDGRYGANIALRECVIRLWPNSRQL